MKEEASRRNDGQTGAEIDGDIIQGRAGNIARQLCRPFRRLLSEHAYSLRILCPSRRLSPIFSHFSILCLPPLSLFFTLCVCMYVCVCILYIFLSFSLFLFLFLYPSIFLSFSLSLFRFLLLSDLFCSYFTHDIYRTFLIHAAARTLHTGSHSTSKLARKLLCERTMRNERSNVP